MYLSNNLGMREIVIILITIAFLFGCFASSYKTAKTLEQKQTALGAGYMRLENLENSDADGIDLLDLNIRHGLAKNFDMGIAYTLDLSSESDNSSLSTYWWDIKAQLSNRENKIGDLTFALGMLKGYTYDPEVHITSIPLLFSIPVNDKIVPTFGYKIAFISDDFIPSNFEDPRHEFTLGMEYSFYKASSERWTPKLGFAVGWFNSLTGGEGDSGLILNFGFTVESPLSY